MAERKERAEVWTARLARRRRPRSTSVSFSIIHSTESGQENAGGRAAERPRETCAFQVLAVPVRTAVAVPEVLRARVRITE